MRRKALIVALAAVAVVGMLLVALDDSFRSFLLKQERGSVRERLEGTTITLANALNSRFSLLQGLKVFTETAVHRGRARADLNASFELFASGLHSSAKGIRNFIVAPDGVNRYVYPLEGNQKALGHNLLLDKRPQVRKDVQRAIYLHDVAVSGPYELRQGGLGLVARVPIFQEVQFWGLVSMVMDVPPLLQDANILPLPDDMSLALADTYGNVFYGDPLVFQADPEVSTIPLPEGSWSLAMAPAGGWDVQISLSVHTFRTLAVLVVLLTAVTVYLFSFRHALLRREVLGRTAELSATVDKLRTEDERRRAVELELQRAKENAEAANRSKSAFLANMSHEIRTPLNGVMGMHQLLRTTTLDAEQQEYVENAIGASRRLTGLLSDILDLSRVEAGKMEITDKPFHLRKVVHIVEQLFASACAQKRLALRMHVDPAIPWTLNGDSLRVQQILNNLVGNAVKFTESGSIELEVWRLPSSLPNTVRVLFSVTDTGFGIEEAKLDALFEPFTQADIGYARKHQGAGLGLSIVKRLVALMGGEVTVFSEPGVGTSFCLSLQFGVSLQEEDDSPESIEETVEPCTGLRVLMAEDDRVSRLSQVRLLEKIGCRVVAVENGRQALDRLGSEDFDVVFMDIQMPEMDGLEATLAIRRGAVGEDKADIVVVALTAYAMAEEKEAFFQAGMNDYLSKPVELVALRNLLSSLAGAH